MLGQAQPLSADIETLRPSSLQSLQSGSSGPAQLSTMQELCPPQARETPVVPCQLTLHPHCCGIPARLALRTFYCPLVFIINEKGPE